MGTSRVSAATRTVMRLRRSSASTSPTMRSLGRRSRATRLSRTGVENEDRRGRDHHAQPAPSCLVTPSGRPQEGRPTGGRPAFVPTAGIGALLMERGYRGGPHQLETRRPWASLPLARASIVAPAAPSGSGTVARRERRRVAPGLAVLAVASGLDQEVGLDARQLLSVALSPLTWARAATPGHRPGCGAQRAGEGPQRPVVASRVRRASA